MLVPAIERVDLVAARFLLVASEPRSLRGQFEDEPVGVAEVDALEVRAVFDLGDADVPLAQVRLPLAERRLVVDAEREVVARARTRRALRVRVLEVGDGGAGLAFGVDEK